jgi:hypothetical protein
MTDIATIIDEHTKHIKELHVTQKEHGASLERHNEHISTLYSTMSDLKEKFGTVATHRDILDLQIKIDDSINGMLRDALNSVPQHAANRMLENKNVWSAITAIAAIITIVIAIILHAV